MQISEFIHVEAIFFEVSLLVGMGLVLVYDVFRILRRVIKHGTVLISIEDCCFWILCTVAVFLLLYRQNDGMVRLFAFIGILIGMWIYLAVFSRFIIRFFVWIFRKIGKIFGKTGRILFGPLIKVVRKIGLFLKKWLKKWYKAIKMSLCKL